jgi:hypothetical protein
MLRLEYTGTSAPWSKTYVRTLVAFRRMDCVTARDKSSGTVSRESEEASERAWEMRETSSVWQAVRIKARGRWGGAALNTEVEAVGAGEGISVTIWIRGIKGF